MRLTLWNEAAEQFDCPINSVIAVKNALVGEFNGKTLSAVSSTTIQVEPEIPETNLLQSKPIIIDFSFHSFSLLYITFHLQIGS